MNESLHRLNAREISIWCTRLTASAGVVTKLREILSEDEKARANAFHFEKHNRYFVISRGLLRTILGRYLGIRPEYVRFAYGPQGKPFLEPSLGHFELQFNLAHSEDLVVYAFSLGRMLGVDVEWIREISDIEEIAKQFFSPLENTDLLRAPVSQRREAFFNCWTRKEAYLKAVGTGLSVPLNRFRVSILPGQPVRFLDLEGDTHPISSWTLVHLTPAEQAVGAIAVPDPCCRIVQLQYSDAEECLASFGDSKDSFNR